jgi:hypothetical protein
MKKRLIPKKFLGAFKRGHRPTSREFIDEKLAYELLNKALAGDLEASKELEWLARFNNEYHKAVLPEDDPNSLHNTKELRRDCNRRSYATKNGYFSTFN